MYIDLNIDSENQDIHDDTSHFKVKEDTVRAGEGGTVELKVYVTGSPTPDVYWRKGRSDDIDTRQGKYIIVDDSSLMVQQILLFIPFMKINSLY